MKADNLFFNETDLRDAYNKVINLLDNIMRFYEIYSGQFQVIEVDYKRLSVLDCWLISRINNIIKQVTIHLDNYDTVKASREIKNFIGELSTWWIRRSRDRFKDAVDGQIAFSLLNRILDNLSRVIAPFMPFVAERIWQKLIVNDRELSVHLALWPEASNDEIPDSIEERMDAARSIVELGHSIRAQNGVRVRQPLARISFNYDFSEDQQEFVSLILTELNVEKFSQKNELIKPVTIFDGGIEVTLDLEIDERLAELGTRRDLIRAIQDLRKKLGFKPSENARLTYFTFTKQANEFIEKNKIQVMDATSLSEIIRISDEPSGNKTLLELNGEKVLISIDL